MKKLIWILLFALITEANASANLNESTFGFIDLLLWEIRESGADNWAQTFHYSDSGRKVAAGLIDAPFDWHSGIRVGIGREFNEHHFDITFAYTHYQAFASNQASGTVASAFDGGYFVNNTNGANLGLTYNNANIRWQIFYNTVDLNLGRNFKLDPILQLHPFVGLKAASINQAIYTNWLTPTIPTNFTSATENLKNDFSGIGPTIGVETAWVIYTGTHQSLSLIGNVAAGLLFGHWHFNEVFANNSGITITTYVNSVNGVSPVTSGLLGLQWNTFFKKSDLSVRLGYEAQLWFNQEQFYSLSMGRANRPVSIQGGDLEFRYNF